MPNLNSTASTLVISGAIALAIGASAGFLLPKHVNEPLFGAAAGTPGATTELPRWATAATGRLEPKGGEVHVTTPIAGRVMAVTVKAGDTVAKDDILVRIDDADVRQKLAAALDEVDVRRRERDEEQAQGAAADRRKAADAAYDSDQDVFHARETLDAARGAGEKAQLEQLKSKLTTLESKATKDHAAHKALLTRGGMPLLTRLESSLEQARSDVATAENALDRTIVRAPLDATVLSVAPKVGEYAAPSAEMPLATLGDLTVLQVRAEVEARDALKVRVGQAVVIKADALPGQEFQGEVTEVAPTLGTPRIPARGPRRPNDVEVLEAVAKLQNAGALKAGMRVDVFFKSDNAASAEKAAPTAAASANAKPE
jgi:HlyD family secretion protein